MTFTTWLALAAVCALGAVSPGPSLAVVVRHTVVNSRAHGLATALSHSVGIGLYALLTSFGLAVLVSANPTVYRVLTFAGAGYLLWLGIGALRAGGGVPAPDGGATSSRVVEAARDGLAISLLNPKIAVFFLALFSQFVQPGMGAAGHAVMSATAMVIDAAWYALVAIALSRPGALERLRRRAHWIDRISGVVLIALAMATVQQSLY